MARQHTAPYILTNNTTRALETAKLPFDEKKLQDFIFAHYQALPIDEIDSVFGPLIPVCTELPTKAGEADILFINEGGLLTLVECKLWKNPQARREVVGQILDYAKELSRWSYDDLQKAVDQKTTKKLYNIVAENSEELDESVFIDRVSRNLKRGRFLLLIVGEGIRESVELIADFLQRHAHLNFSFGLVEFGIFQLPEEVGGGYLVHPRLVVRTVELIRAVIRIEDAKVIAEAPTFVTKSTLSSDQKGTTITEQTFYEKLASATNPATVQAVRDFFDKAEALGIGLKKYQVSVGSR